ncbi:MAG: hypothetical protein EXR01_06805 [Acetobacteraceae bacterium]|nr:hypothetical protein [Acetobacteraceae bacterium]
MRHGGLSRTAVTALSHGEQQSGIWMATGDGGLALVHLAGGCDIVM